MRKGQVFDSSKGCLDGQPFEIYISRNTRSAAYMEKRLVTLIILDGFGINERTEGNAVAAAYKPNLDRYLREYPNTIIRTSGMDVGLPRGQMGNSEVGHTNIGAGRIVYQELTRITKSIEDGDFFEKRNS